MQEGLHSWDSKHACVSASIAVHVMRGMVCLALHVTHDVVLQVLAWELHRAQPSVGGRILDLLFVAANEGCRQAFRSLIDYNKRYTKVLSGGDVKPASATDSAGTSSSSHLEQEVEQLLLTCLATKQTDLVRLLVEEASAMALLGESMPNTVSALHMCPQGLRP